MLTRRLVLALSLGSALLGACKEGDDPDNTTDSSSDGSSGAATEGATDSTGEATAGPGCDQSDCSAMCAEWHDEPCHTPYLGKCEADECVCEAQADDCEVPQFPPVACGEAMCDEGQICVQPGLDCDYSTDPPEFFTPPPRCEDVPAACEAKLDFELSFCLGGEFCGPSVVGDPEYADGQLSCPPEAADCF
jgi:hypothetical protein